jgi:23S rRNA pseudouridine2605 synthase
MIAQGRVSVNGKRAEVGMSADAGTDEITVDGRPLPPASEREYILLYKPYGYITAMSDKRGGRTVDALTRDVGTRVYPAGRLDMDSEGMLIMTNDGEFALAVAHPSRGKTKTYRARVRGDVSGAEERLRVPMEMDGRIVSPVSVTVISADGGDEAELEIVLREGRNRQIRRMCLRCGLRVVALKRVAIAGVELGDLQPGRWRRLTPEEVRILGETPEGKTDGKKQVGGGEKQT